MKMRSDSAPCITIIGVAEDIHQNSITNDRGLNYYLPIAQFHPEAAVIFARVRGEPDSHSESLRRALQPLMPGDGYVTVTPRRDIIAPQLRSWGLGASMVAAFGGLALVLAAIGLNGAIAYDVAQRTHEVGVRLALGARASDVMRLVVGDGVRVAAAGVLTGGVVAFWAGAWIAPLLYAQSPRDPLVYGGVAVILLAVAVAAGALPALRAARIDPNIALRVE